MTTGRRPLVAATLIVVGQLTNAYISLTFMGSYLVNYLAETGSRLAAGTTHGSNPE
jgi:hypothetical protein